MSQENVELVKGWFGRWNRGERFSEEELHPEVEIFSRFQSIPYRGSAEFRRWTDEIDEQFEHWQLIVDEWREAGGCRVVALGHVHMRGHGSGVEFDQPVAWVVDVEDGKLRRLRPFVDRDEALEAAGLSE